MNRQKLKAKLVEAGLSQKDAAAAIGLSENAFSRKVCGLNEFTAGEISSLSAVAGIADAEEVVEIFLTGVSQKWDEPIRKEDT